MSDIGNKDVFAKNLSYYIEKSGKTRGEICEDLGIAYSTFSEWINGRKYPRIDKIEQLANYFGILKSQLIESTSSQPNAFQLPPENIRMVPLYESAAAGFGAYANSCAIGSIPCYIASEWEAENSIAIKVRGDSMYPKIEDGDIVIVCKDMEYDDGKIVVARIDEDEAVVKRLRIYTEKLVLESINPEYQDRVFERDDMNRVSIEGVVRRIIKEV